MKKSHQIIIVGTIILLIVAVGVLIYFSEGVRLRNSHFFRIELTPKIEFLTDNDNIVNTVYPVNKDAEVLITGEEFVGLKIDDAITKFLTLCADMGYLDLESNKNGVQISVSSSFTQSLENKIYKTCNDFFINNQIMCVIAESDADLALFNEKKEKNVFNIEKLVLIKSVLEKTEKYTFLDLNNKNESELIDILEDLHKIKQESLQIANQDYLNAKNEKMALYKDKFNAHKLNITDETQREFSKKYSDFKKSETYNWELDFAKKLQENNNN